MLNFFYESRSMHDKHIAFCVKKPGAQRSSPESTESMLLADLQLSTSKFSFDEAFKL